VQKTTILNDIWSGRITGMPLNTASPVDRILKALLPVKAVCLAMEDCPQSLVLTDRTDLDGFQLGDVVAQELDVMVPYGALVVIHDKELGLASAEDVSYAIGRIVGQALIMAVQADCVDISRENEALYIMSVCYSKVAHTQFLRDIGLRAEHFHLGLASALRTFWIGTDSPAKDLSDIFVNYNFLGSDAFHSYMRDLDSSFAPPKQSVINSSMIMFPNTECSFQDWQMMVAIRAAKVASLGKPADMPSWNSMLTGSLVRALATAKS
jgi:hypothetical protein